MGFLVSGLKLLGERITNFLKKDQKNEEKKKTIRRFFAFEPLRKLVHIINSEYMLEKFLARLSVENREIKQFSDGKFYREITVSLHQWQLAIDKMFESIVCWGNIGLKLEAVLANGKLLFKPITISGDIIETNNSVRSEVDGNSFSSNQVRLPSKIPTEENGEK